MRSMPTGRPAVPFQYRGEAAPAKRYKGALWVHTCTHTHTESTSKLQGYAFLIGNLYLRHDSSELPERRRLL